MGKINKNIKAKAKIAVQKVNTKAKQENHCLIAKNIEDKDVALHKTVTSKKITRKKDKIKQKHKNLINKFAVMKKLRKEEIARKNREKTAITGDMKPLKDALPSLDELFRLTKEKNEIKTGFKELDEQSQKLNPIQKLKQKKKNFISQVNSYQNLLNNPEYKKNPRETIAFHIKYTHALSNQ